MNAFFLKFALNLHASVVLVAEDLPNTKDLTVTLYNVRKAVKRSFFCKVGHKTC